MHIQLACAANFDIGSENYILDFLSLQVIWKKGDFAKVVTHSRDGFAKWDSGSRKLISTEGG
jgi:hypothetical protein